MFFCLTDTERPAEEILMSAVLLFPVNNRSLKVWRTWKMCQKYKTGRCFVLRPSSRCLTGIIRISLRLYNSAVGSGGVSLFFCQRPHVASNTHLSKALTVGLLLKLTHAALWYFTSHDSPLQLPQSATEEKSLFVCLRLGVFRRSDI